MKSTNWQYVVFVIYSIIYKDDTTNMSSDVLYVLFDVWDIEKFSTTVFNI